jgi:DHA1 family bicyclomycin/chloramphenicol resistance-like MFS transporter
MAVAPAISPVIGGKLVEWFGWRAGFVFLIGCGGVILMAAFRHLPETRQRSRAGSGWATAVASYRAVLRSPVFLGFALCLAFTSGAFFAFIAGAPFIVVNRLHGAPSDYGISFLMVSAGYITGSFIASRLSVRLGVDRMIVIGTAIALVGCGLLAGCAAAGVADLFVLFATMGLIAVGNGIGQPSSIVAGVAAVDARAAGTASGLIGFGQMAIGGLATLAVLRLDDGSYRPLIAVMMGSTTLAGLAYLVAVLSDRAALRERLAVRH